MTNSNDVTTYANEGKYGISTIIRTLVLDFNDFYLHNNLTSLCKYSFGLVPNVSCPTQALNHNCFFFIR